MASVFVLLEAFNRKEAAALGFFPCEYDSHANPVDCQLIIVDEGVKPAIERVYTIKNTIDYY